MSAASLIESLVVSGSRLASGAANDTGKVFAYVVGTNTLAVLYSSPDCSTVITQPITLTDGGKVSTADFPSGIFAATPVTLHIEDSSGTTVSDTTWWPASASTTALSNAGFTDDTMDEALSKGYASTGGTDFTYLESAGATERLIQDKFREIWLSVKDFGAVGNGIAIDTSAVQQTINRAIALGGAVVYFPPGTYKLDQAITVATSTGISLVGA